MASTADGAPVPQGWHKFVLTTLVVVSLLVFTMKRDPARYKASAAFRSRTTHQPDLFHPHFFNFFTTFFSSAQSNAVPHNAVPRNAIGMFSIISCILSSATGYMAMFPRSNHLFTSILKIVSPTPVLSLHTRSLHFCPHSTRVPSSSHPLFLILHPLLASFHFSPLAFSSLVDSRSGPAVLHNI